MVHCHPGIPESLQPDNRVNAERESLVNWKINSHEQAQSELCPVLHPAFCKWRGRSMPDGEQSNEIAVLAHFLNIRSSLYDAIIDFFA